MGASTGSKGHNLEEHEEGQRKYLAHVTTGWTTHGINNACE